LVGGDRLLSHPHTLHTSLVSAPITNLDHKESGSAVVAKDGTQSKTRWRGERTQRGTGGIGVLSFPDPGVDWNISNSTKRILVGKLRAAQQLNTYPAFYEGRTYVSVLTSLPPVPVMSQMNPANTFPNLFLSNLFCY